jgi:hypothetical protein
MIDDFPKEVLEQLERLETVNGITVTEDGDMDIQMAFDGHAVTFRGENGELEQMGLLCYLHYIMAHFIDELTDENGDCIQKDGITPGHILCHLTDHLHQQYHQLAEDSQSEMMSDMTEIIAVMDSMSDEDAIDAPAEPAESDDDEIVIHGSANDPTRHH